MDFFRRRFPKKTPRRTPRIESRLAGQVRRRLHPAITFWRARQRRVKDIFRRVLLWGGGAFFIVFLWFFYTLPDIDDLNKFVKEPSIVVKAEDGQIIGSFGNIYGDYIPFAELPNSLVDAVIATEDRNFYHHFGIDPVGLLRATIANVRARHVVQGGSTVTQQVAKNVFLTPERSITRKIREMLLAIKLERRFTKEEIMSIYLNRVYLGAGSYGVDAAAKRYFGKSARDLTLTESSIMAGLLKAPSRFAPTSNPGQAYKRAVQVLHNMQEAGFLTQPQAERAEADLTKTMGARKRTPQSNLYFADWILDQIPDYVGNVQEDLVVMTTLRPEWQLMADKAITDVMDKEGVEKNAHQAALLAMTTDGAVRAIIGGRSYGESQFNRATQSLRQPGSSFKLFVYLAGLESGFTPDTLVDDHPITIDAGVSGKWSPKNYTGKYLGVIPLREAVAQSVNTVAVQVSEQAGLSHVIDVARRLGITSTLEPLHSIALGATEVSLLELTNAYAHLATGGHIVYPYGITEITTKNGDPVYTRYATERGAVLRSDIVGQMNELLLGVIDHGTGRAANIGRPVAGKTGTTSDYKDAWFIGFTPDLVTGVWVGNDDNTPMKKVTGGMLPAKIWHDFMIQATANMPVREIPTSGFSLPWESPLSVRPGQQQGAPLPWADTNAPQQPPAEVVVIPGGPEPQEQQPEDMDSSFWNNIMGGSDERPQREYPGQPR